MLSAGGVRSQFSLEENVRCSLYGLEVFKEVRRGGDVRRLTKFNFITNS